MAVARGGEHEREQEFQMGQQWTCFGGLRGGRGQIGVARAR